MRAKEKEKENVAELHETNKRIEDLVQVVQSLARSNVQENQTHDVLKPYPELPESLDQRQEDFNGQLRDCVSALPPDAGRATFAFGT